LVVAVPHHHPCTGVVPPHALHALSGRTGRVCGLHNPPLCVFLHCLAHLRAPRGLADGVRLRNAASRTDSLGTSRAGGALFTRAARSPCPCALRVHCVRSCALSTAGRCAQWGQVVRGLSFMVPSLFFFGLHVFCPAPQLNTPTLHSGPGDAAQFAGGG
jgi:hypothetical protein